MEDDEVIIYFANKAPIRAKRMDIRRFPKLEARMSKVAPAVPELPPLRDDALASLLQGKDGLRGEGTEHQPGFVNPEQPLTFLPAS